MSQSVRFFLVAILPNALPHDLALNKPNTFWIWLWFRRLHCLACHMLLLSDGTDWNAELKIDISMILQFKNCHKEIFTSEWWTFVSGPILHSGPYLRTGTWGPGPGRQIFRGSILKKSRLKYGMQEKKHNKFSQRLYCRRCRITYIFDSTVVN